MENVVPVGAAYDVVFPLLKPLKFNTSCGIKELRLPTVPVVVEKYAVVISVEEKIEAGRRWDCCLTGYMVGLNPHLPSLANFLSGKWELTGTLQLIT